MQHILVTGAAGYIGSHSVYHLLENTLSKVTIIDNLSSGFIENIQYLKFKFKDRVKFINLDLNNIYFLESLLKNNKFDMVIHFAASLIVSESTINPILYYENNTKNTLSLISLCIKFGINKFIFSSTAAVYGEPKSIPIKEDNYLLPINPYGNSKMMIEIMLKDAALAYNDFNFVVLRYFNVSGALNSNNYNSKYVLGQRSKNATHLIKVACECAIGKREFINVFGDDYNTNDGTCIRDYIHIDDLALSHLSAYEFLLKNDRSEFFNVGYGKGYSVKEIINKVKEISNINFNVNIVGRRNGDPASLISSNQKILNLTSWKPKFDNIDLIIKSAYEWELYLANN